MISLLRLLFPYATCIHCDKDGEKRYDYSFVVQGFRFGAPGRAKREAFESRRDEKEIDALETEI